ncbi:thermonuclease family protein [Seinonella peptonophila]|uniref:thermonuclease family protein n=1 Tax=Seinonella peptonophila TaxID=112248 RepID=UPI000932695B|nr:thermonuclease family protein [Seinonella peptonophila]
MHQRERVKLLTVTDGDTIVVNWHGKRERVRLLLIDSPEMNYSLKDSSPDPYAFEAKIFLENELLLAETIELEFDSQQRDNHGRLLAHLFADGKNVNLALLDEGLARYAFEFAEYKYSADYKEAERKAKEKKRNIWSRENYVTQRGFYNPQPKRIMRLR